MFALCMCSVYTMCKVASSMGSFHIEQKLCEEKYKKTPSTAANRAIFANNNRKILCCKYIYAILLYCSTAIIYNVAWCDPYGLRIWEIPVPHPSSAHNSNAWCKQDLVEWNCTVSPLPGAIVQPFSYLIFYSMSRHIRYLFSFSSASCEWWTFIIHIFCKWQQFFFALFGRYVWAAECPHEFIAGPRIMMIITVKSYFVYVGESLIDFCCCCPFAYYRIIRSTAYCIFSMLNVHHLSVDNNDMCLTCIEQ